MLNRTGPGLDEATRAIIAVGRAFDARGWAPATAGNYSVRLADGRIAITTSGTHKGRLEPDDVMLLGADGVALDGRRPSAEAALHVALYARSSGVGAVLHSHSPTSVGYARAFRDQHSLTLSRHELLKALPGCTTHDTEVSIPIVENSQDMAEIESAIMHRIGDAPAYLIRDHGLYAWGIDIAEAERVTEAIEWMIAADLAAHSFTTSAA